MVLLYFNPRCGTARNVRSMLAEADVDVEVVEYLKTPPDAATLRDLVARLDDPPADLVRKDARFKKLGLEPGDYVSTDQVVDVLVEHPELLQRPLVVTEDAVLIGRPVGRVQAWLAARD